MEHGGDVLIHGVHTLQAVGNALLQSYQRLLLPVGVRVIASTPAMVMVLNCKESPIVVSAECSRDDDGSASSQPLLHESSWEDVGDYP